MGEACRLWLRSEDNDSVGLTPLPTLFTRLPQSAPQLSRHQPTPSLLIPHLSKEALLSDNAKACHRRFWSSCDVALCDRPQTQIFSFPLKEPELRRLLEKHLTQLQRKYFTTLQPFVTFISTSERELDAWMCLYVNVNGAWMGLFCVKIFHPLSFLATTYASPSSQRQAKV